MTDSSPKRGNNQHSNLDNIVDATELLRQGNARIAKARELLKEIPEYLYHHEILSRAHYDIDTNIKKLDQLTSLIDEHNDLKGLS